MLHMIDDLISSGSLEHDTKRRREEGREKEWKFPLWEKERPAFEAMRNHRGTGPHAYAYSLFLVARRAATDLKWLRRI